VIETNVDAVKEVVEVVEQKPTVNEAEQASKWKSWCG
jgi:hypothetical protein